MASSFARALARPFRRKRSDRGPLLRLAAPRGSLVFDVGANVGDTVAVFRGAGATVIAFEPNPACVASLRERFAGDPSVTVVAKGLGAEPGELELAICDEASTLSTFSREWQTGRFQSFSWDRSERVPVTTLRDAVIEHGSPDLVKIDVEGFELDVVRGLGELPDAMCFEFTFEFRDAARRVAQHIATLGDASFALSMAESGRVRDGGWLTQEALGEALSSLAVGDWGDVWVVKADGASPLLDLPPDLVG